MCPICQEVLQLPKTMADVPSDSGVESLVSVAPSQPSEVEPIPELEHIHDEVTPPFWRELFTTPVGRKKLAIALGLPLVLVAVVLVFMPSAQEPVVASQEPLEMPLPEVTAPAAPTEEPAMPQEASPPESVEIVPEPPAEPAPEIKVEPAVATPVVQTPAAIDPEEGLVEAVPVETPTPAPVIEAPSPPSSGEEPAMTIHEVIIGDNLTTISAKYRVTIQEILKANDLESDTVQVGQKLRIPGAAPQVPVPPPVVEAPMKKEPRFHTVVRGDTLTRIARKYSVDAKAIMQANGMKNDIVRLGAKLTIPPTDP
jgi:LysM repeat protein